MVLIGKINNVGYLCILAFANIFLGCNTNVKYIVVTQEEYQSSMKGQQARFIVLEDSIVAKDPEIYNKVIEHLISKSYKELDTFIKSYMGNYTDIELSSAIKSMAIGQYDQAKIHLDNIDDPDYFCFVKLLKTDCMYEDQKKLKMIKFDELLLEYQGVYDCNPTELHKYIINSKVKSVRYEL